MSAQEKAPRLEGDLLHLYSHREALCALGKAQRMADGRCIYCLEGIGDFEREFTRKTVLQLLKTAQSLLRILGQTKLD
jgi:hypothetical protein